MEEYFSSFVNLYEEITDFGDEGRTKIAGKYTRKVHSLSKRLICRVHIWYVGSWLNLYCFIVKETVVDKTYGIDVKLEESKKVVKDVYGEIKEDDELSIAVAII